MSRELLQLQEQAVPLDTFVCNAAIIAYGKGNWDVARFHMISLVLTATKLMKSAQTIATSHDLGPKM